MTRGTALRQSAAAVLAMVLGLVLVGPADAAAPASAPALTPRIVNGSEAAAGEFGYVVSLLDAARIPADGPFQAQFCGGALTTPTTVVTAAHCLVNQKSGRVAQPAEVAVGVGRSLRSPSPRIHPVASIAIHPSYDIDTARGDLAVVTLAEPATDVEPVTPLRPTDLPGYLDAGAPALVAGWGNQSRTGNSFPDTLRIGSVVVFPDRACAAGSKYVINNLTFTGFGDGDMDTTTMLCAAGVTPTGQVIDACQGDSGGPLIGGTGAAARLIGVVSWGEDCATMHPGVYTRLSAMTDFLVANAALVTLAPTAAPGIAVEPLSQAVRVRFTPAPDGSVISTFAATATDPATGQVASCFARPRKDRLAATCTITGLVNGTAVVVAGIGANALGNSPASAQQVVTPIAVPTPAPITAAKALAGGRARFAVGTTEANGSPLLAERVACLPLRGGPGRSARVVDHRATVSGLLPIRYACTVAARNALGTATSDPRLVVGRR